MASCCCYPHGRVGAKIVCDDTLVQYAAYWLPFLACGAGSGIIRFRLFWWGWRFTFFFPGQLFLAFPVPCGGSAFCRFVRWGGGLERIFFGDLANCGVVGHVPQVLLGLDCVHGQWVLSGGWMIGDGYISVFAYGVRGTLDLFCSNWSKYSRDIKCWCRFCWITRNTIVA